MPRKDFLGKIKYVLEDPKINPDAGKEGYKKLYGYRRKQLTIKGKPLKLEAYSGKKI